jgi:uncharacterized protein (DUF305 family)
LYASKIKNAAIFSGSIFLICLSTFLVRQQIPLNEVKWMEAMIPYHSIAILTSNRGNLKDPEVKKLAKNIIKAQEEEIAEMKKMIKRPKNEQ